MKPKKLYAIVYIVIGILIAAFAVLWYMSSKNPDLNFITYIAGISSFFVAILSALNVYTTSSQIEVANRQLEEMKYERSMSEQPLLKVENLKFSIEKPRFFYTPPEDDYSFQSRYVVTADVKNCSNYPAVSVDATVEIKVKHQKDVFTLPTVSRRISVIAPGDSHPIVFQFSGDEITWLFDALRSSRAQELPQIIYELTYGNLCGGFFQLDGQAILAPKEDLIETIRQWHSRINAACVEERESISYLRTIKGTEEWEKTFDKIKSDFASSLADSSDVEVDCLELPEKCCICSITAEQYKDKKEKYQYSHYVHRAANCDTKKR